VNGSQSKFLTGTWPMSQIQPETALFQPDQDRLAIDKLSAFGTGLGTVTKTRRDANNTTQEIVNKDLTQKQFISSQAFHRTLGGRVRETTTEEQFRPQLFETLDTAAQNHAGNSTCNKFHTQTPCNTPITAHNRSLLGTEPRARTPGRSSQSKHPNRSQYISGKATHKSSTCIG
jgi:hypothetical protein